MPSEVTTFILPGRDNSGPNHWQTRWETANPGFRRVNQRDWVDPRRDEWCRTLEASMEAYGDDQTVFIAHSLGCLLTAHWSLYTKHRIKAALLVAPTNPERPDFHPGTVGFSPVPQVRLPFNSIVVASANDPRGSLQYATRCAEAWGSEFINIGEAGHINADSGLGDWAFGFALYQRLARSNLPAGTLS